MSLLLFAALVSASAATAASVPTAASVRSCLAKQKILAWPQPVKPYAYERNAVSVLTLSFVLRGDSSATVARVALYPTSADAAKAVDSLHAWWAKDHGQTLGRMPFSSFARQRGASLLVWSLQPLAWQPRALSCLR